MTTQMELQSSSSSEKILTTLEKIKDMHVAYQEKEYLKELEKKNRAQRRERWGNMFLVFTMLTFGVLAYHTHTTHMNDNKLLLNEMIKNASQTNSDLQAFKFYPRLPTSTLVKQK